MTAPKAVLELIERFRRNRESYESVHYNETQLRREFVDPTFEALGWDVNNRQGYAEAYKHVVHEDSLRIDGIARSPDYSFRVGGIRKFFLETKKPSLNLKSDPDPAFQLRRYAWSAKLPLSVLTSFSEWAVYDTRVRPNPKDKSSAARVLYIPLEELDERWMELAGLFSLEALQKGEFDKYAQESTKKPGTAAVDDAFLEDIEEWREWLAHNFALRNPGLDTRELNAAVQLTIDRIVFLRICEDRGIELWGDLMTLLNGTNVYTRLFDLFGRADARYNSGLFHFRKEKERDEPPDTLTPTLVVDDKPLKDIISRLYPPASPYAFGVIPAEILGHIYERFLGKVIRLTAGHRAVIEEKPEVRKAGGVYYTPTHVVDFIVRETLGRLVEGKTLKTIRDLRVVDPACGSGTFLLGAYQFFLDWHLSHYLTDGPNKWLGGRVPRLHRTGTSALRLSTSERKRILLAHVHGVDIDAQAVEVTKLSLLLRVLEGETAQTLQSEFAAFRERALPDLSKNIKCGNSLVGQDFFDSQQTALFDTGETERINAFDWESEFQDAMKKGGFDAVIGNPPWVDIKGLDPMLVDYCFKKFSTTENRMNLFAAFLHRGIDLVCPRGRLGYIIPSSLLAQSSYKSLRAYLLEHANPASIVRMPDRTFEHVVAESAIVVFEKSRGHKCEVLLFDAKAKLSSVDRRDAMSSRGIDTNAWRRSEDRIFDIFNTGDELRIAEKVESAGVPLLELCDFSLGLTPYDKYKGHSESQIESQVFHATTRKNKTFKPLISGGDIHRYSVIWSGGSFISYGSWLGAPREKRFFTLPRILVRQIASGEPPRIFAGYSEEELYNTQVAFNLLPRPSTTVSLKYVLALLNSRLLSFYHTVKFLDRSKRTFQKILIQDAKRLPLKVLDLHDPKARKLHSSIVSFTERMMQLQGKLAKSADGHARTLLERQLLATEQLIDDEVYELYGLTASEATFVKQWGQ